MSAVIRRVRFPAALLTLAVVCALLVARLPPDLERTVVTRRHHGSDPLLSAALLRFAVDSLIHGPARYFTPPILHPDPNPLRGTEPLLAEALLAVPFRLALGDEPAAVYTLTKLATLALVALFTGLLLRELGVRPALSLLGGGMAVLVGTMPVFVDRLQAVSIQWLALAGLFAARFLRLERRADAALLGLATFLAVQSSLYTSVMLLVPLPFLAPVLWSRRRALARAWPLTVGVCAAAVLSVAVLWPYLQHRADVAAYSSLAYAAVKTWSPAALGDLAISPPEYAWWPLGPGADWLGQYPGTAFLLLMAGCALLSAAAPASPRPPRGDGARHTKALLAGALAGLAVAVVWSARSPGSEPARLAADALLWLAVGAWSLRLALWPDEGAGDGAGSGGAPIALLASGAALAAFVLLLVSLGSPIRWQAGSAPLLEGLFEPLSHVLPPVRELRELNRCLLPASWFAVVAAALTLERRLRARPAGQAAAIGIILAAAVLLTGVSERAFADTRKGTAPVVPAPYALLRQSTGTGGLLELPFDPWGRIDSVYRMLWQPAHGRPIVAGRTGIEPAWYVPASRVFEGFPSPESLRLARAWRVDTVLDTRPTEPAAATGTPWPAGLLLRAERAAQAGRRTDARWRLFDLAPAGAQAGIEEEPSPGPGEWRQPSVADARDAAACDGRTETAAEVRPEGLELAAPQGSTLGAVEIDYGRGLYNRVPPTLSVLGLENGAWRELAEGPAAAWLRARAAHQLLRDQQARLVVPLTPSRASRVRLVSAAEPWDAPEVRLRVVPDR